MKTLIFFIMASLFALFAQENTTLKGTYKVEFDKKYAQQGYKITFADSTYKKVMPDFVAYKGTITYEKFKAIIRKDKDDNPIEIDKREIGKDTIKFTTKSKTDLSVIVNRGKMIKAK